MFVRVSLFAVLLLCVSGVVSCGLRAQSSIALQRYEKAYREMVGMLEGRQKLSVKRAVYLAENAYLDGKLDYEKDFNEPIRKTVDYLKRIIAINHLEKYKTGKQMALCSYFFNPYSGNNYQSFEYDFSGEFPDDDWHYQLVSRTMKTHKGQCRSLPWTLKLYAEELGAEVHIAHAPRHCFLMYRDLDNQTPEKWINVALTSHQYVPTFSLKDIFEIKDSAVIVGTYLTPLTDVQTIACQLSEMAQVYVDKYGKYDQFTYKCTSKSLKYYRRNPCAIIIKGKSLDALARRHAKNNGNRMDAYMKSNIEEQKACFEELRKTYWTQETPRLRKKWNKTPEEIEEMKKHVININK